MTWNDKKTRNKKISGILYNIKYEIRGPITRNPICKLTDLSQEGATSVLTYELRPYLSGCINGQFGLPGR
jgi:hypothetical protein